MYVEAARIGARLYITVRTARATHSALAERAHFRYLHRWTWRGDALATDLPGTYPPAPNCVYPRPHQRAPSHAGRVPRPRRTPRRYVWRRDGLPQVPHDDGASGVGRV